MCMNFDSKSKVQIANKDITVYKIMDVTYDDDGEVYDDRWNSSIQDFLYMAGKTYRIPLADWKVNELNLKAFHENDEERPHYVFGHAFHSYWTLKEAKRQFIDNSRERIIRCIIPKGARYIVGNKYDHEVVSSRIRIVGAVKVRS